jgi:hypothetical protein
MSEKAAIMDRDFSEEFSITLEWWQWNRVLHLADAGLKWKSDDSLGIDWSGTDEIEEDEEILETLKLEYFDTRPGNGMDDWPDSMKEAYDETVRQMMAEELNNE